MASCRQCYACQVRADKLHKDRAMRTWPDDYHCFFEHWVWDWDAHLCEKYLFTSDWEDRA